MDGTGAAGTEGQTLELRVEQYLRDAILGGQLRAGDRIVADAVARALGVSRLPVRQALLHLDGSGLVAMRPNRGAVVPAPAGSPGSELRELLEVRRRLEPWAAAQAAHHRTDDDLDVLRDHLRGGTAAMRAGDLAAANVAHHALLRAFARASHHAVVAEALRPLHNRTSVLFTALAGTHLPDSWEHHEAVLECIAARDATGAARHVRTHLDSVARALRRRTRADDQRYELGAPKACR